MNIGFLTPEYPHPITGLSGGIGTSVFNLAHELRAMNNKIFVFVTGQSHDGCIEDEGIVIIRIKNIKCRGFSWLLTRRKFEKIINSYVIREGLAVVEAPDWSGLTAFTDIKCPVVIRCNGSDTYFCFLEGRKIKWPNRLLEMRALQGARGIISVSHFTADVTAKLFGIHRNRFQIIPNGIQPHRFAAATDFKTNSILYFGTLIRKKGLLELPLIFNEVLSKNSAATLTLIGVDSIDYLTNQSTWQMMRVLFSEQASRNVNYKGPLAYKELAREIMSAHVCVFPSFCEAFPVSWLEAMACGKAIVASNIGWAGECILDGEEGFLVDPKKHQEFAARILELLSDPGMSAAFGSRAASRVRREFNSQEIANKTLRFYERVVNE